MGCLEKKLVVELDGGQHARQGHYDEKRTLFLQSKGYTVLRFWNNEVFKETEAVLNEILCNLNKDDQNLLSPALSSCKERRRRGGASL